MKNNHILILLLVVTSMFIGSCNTDDDDTGLTIDDLIGTYIGAMNVQDPSFSNAQYSVVVTKLTASRVQISPAGSAGTEWNATMTRILGVYTCVSCVLNDQITFTEVGGHIELTYNYDDNNEQFAGVKQ